MKSKKKTSLFLRELKESIERKAWISWTSCHIYQYHVSVKILQVLPYLEKGGAERVVIELCNSLTIKGFDITLLLISPVELNLNQENLDARVNVLYIHSSKNGKISWIFRLIPWIIQNQKRLKSFRVIHCHLTFGLTFGSLIYVFRAFQKSKTPKLIFTCHMVGIGGWQRFFNRRFTSFFDSFILVGWNQDWFEFSTKKVHKNISVIENGISVHESNFGTKVPISKPILNLGTISRLVSERRPWLFLQTFSEIRNLDKDIYKFVLGGEGPLRENLNDLIQELNLTNYVTMPGLVTDPSTFLEQIHLYLTICVEKFPGIAALEAIFHGIPVVGIQLMPNYSRDDTELIWSDEDLKVVAMKIVNLINNPTLLEAYRQKQYRLARERNHVSGMTEKYLEKYEINFS